MIDTTKIIHAPVGGGRYTVTAPIIKEDYGLYLLIEGLELPSTYEVDFSNSEHNGTSVTMIGNSDGVLIPSQFIKSGKDVFAFLYHVGVDYGRTVYKFRIPNKLRPDRTDEEPTPEEQSVIDQTIAALNTAVAKTAQDVVDADASAQSASQSAESAEQSAQTSRGWAESAEDYAQSAEQSELQASASATASAQSASQSAQIKDDVESMVDDAQGYANSASQSATASANSASQASASATSASQSASSAQGYASQAQTSAQTATAKASEASTSAQTASAKATEASQSATTASNKATEASGYATSASQAKTDAESARDSAQGYASDAQGYANDAQASAESISASASQIAQNTSDIASLEADIYKPYATDTASGAIASFTDGADDIPLKSLVVDINPVQDLHGYDSPWVGGGGKNKLFLTATTTTINGVTFTVNDDGTIVANGTASDDIVFEIWSKAQNNGNVLLPAGQYIVNGGANGGGTSTYRVGSNGFAWSGGTLKTETDSLTFTITENEAQTNIWIQVFNGTSLSNVVFKPMIRLASVADATFVPYENICPISGWNGMVGFNDPVRGGVINWNQLAKNGNFEDTSNWRGAGSVISFTVENGEAVVVARASTDNTFLDQSSMTIIQGHKYYIGCDFKKDSTPRYLFVTTYPQGIYGRKLTSDTEGYWNIIVTASKNVNGLFRIGMRTDDPQGEWTYRIANVQFIDLTQVFGEGNEPTISEFRELFPNDYYDYNAGEKTCVSEVNDNTFKDISISFGQTVYGGKLDVLSGVLTVERAMVILDGTESWSKPDNGFLTAKYKSDKSYPDAICSTYIVAKSYSGVNGTDKRIAITTSGVRLHDSQFANATALKTYLAENNVQLCYNLKNPIEIQLDGHTLNSLYGQNNIFADTGDTSVEYRANTKLYIDRLTEPDADMIADSNITSGKYFMVGNNLYLATANIASGSAVIVGTNAVRKSLSEALNEINA